MYNKVSPQIDQNGHSGSSTKVKSADGVEKRELSYTVGGNVSQHTTRENIMKVLKKPNMEVTCEAVTANAMTGSLD